MARKFIVIGGSGLIGKKVVNNLSRLGHEVVAASPSSGVDTMTGKGLAEALVGADVVVDVSNSPSFEDAAVLHFFKTAGRNILAAERQAGVGHHVALSVVGSDRLPDSGYLRAKMAQVTLIRNGGVPYSIVRATQFFEFMGAIAQSSIDGDVVRLSTGAMQPIAADDVAAALTDVAVGPPLNRIVEIAGPDKHPMAQFVEQFMRATGDRREVVADAGARYFGAQLDDASLTPGSDARIGAISYAAWLARSAPRP